MSDLNKNLKLLRLSGMILTCDVVSMVDDKEHNTAETTPSILCEDACDDFEYMYMMLTLFKKSLQQYSSVERKPQYRPVSPDMYIYLQTCTLQATATKGRAFGRARPCNPPALLFAMF